MENQPEITFEEAYKRLDEIVRELDNSDTPLEKSFILFEEGQKLLKICNQMLDRAEKRLKVLVETETGFNVREEDLG